MVIYKGKGVNLKKVIKVNKIIEHLFVMTREC